MALGGGNFTAQNKVLPGSYINFVSPASANAALSDRGIAAMPVTGDWGELGSVLRLTAADLQKNSLALFGCDYTADNLKPLREVFRNAAICYIYRLGTGGKEASNAYGRAKYAGTRGNALHIIVSENVDDAAKKDVSVSLDGILIASQTVTDAADLVDDDYVVYDKTGELVGTAGTPMTGGTDPAVTNADHQSFLDAMESYSFHALACPSSDAAVNGLYAAYTKRLRDEQGVKFQCVCYNNPADYEGVVNIMNTVTDAGADPYALVYWTLGAIAGTAVNKSVLNKVYDGEYTPDAAYTQAQLAQALQDGKFAYHRVGEDIRVLADINSLVSTTSEKGSMFKQNQAIRVIDQIANDIAVLFNSRYLGVMPNDAGGRVSLWSDIVKHHNQMQAAGAIEDFDGARDVTVLPGDGKNSVVVNDAVTIVHAMEKLYMTVVVS